MSGAWVQTASGGAIDLLDPQPDQINLRDIATGLSRQMRYAGQTRRDLHGYSVAQHSLLISRRAPRDLRLVALMHDAAEAYLGDVPAPVKALVSGFDLLEARLHRAIARRFLFDPDIPEAVKALDRAILHDEKRDVMAPAPRPWGLTGDGLGVAIVPWMPARAAAEFEGWFHVLTEGRFQ